MPRSPCGGSLQLLRSSACPFSFKAPEALVLRRLALDPSTSRVDHLADARVAIFQDELPAPGAALDDLQARVDSGLGLLIVMGPHIDPASLRALTHDAVAQTGVVDAPMGPKHATASEKIAATIAYVGPKSDLLATQVSWNAAVRVYEGSLLAVGADAMVLVATTSTDPVHARTPIRTRIKLGRGTVYILNVWLSEGTLEAGQYSYRQMLLGARGTRNYDFQRFFFFNYAGLVPRLLLSADCSDGTKARCRNSETRRTWCRRRSRVSPCSAIMSQRWAPG